MPVLRPGSFVKFPESSHSWIQRVTENLRLALALAPVRVPACAVSGAAMHFESVELSARKNSAQTFSAGAHAMALAVLLFGAAVVPHRPVHLGPIADGTTSKLLPYVPSLHPQGTGRPSLGPDGSGGGRESLSTRHGNLAPPSSRPLAPPRKVDNDSVALPVPPAVYDPNAPENVAAVKGLGFPWSDADTNSAGRGKGRGFGDSVGDDMGNGHRQGAGGSEGGGPYADVVSPVACLYCPEPLYSEEARKAKLQDKVLLEVLVGTDGKAQRIRIVEGLGLGLDERAIEAVRTWKFSPGRDAARRPVAAWVTIETHFQLF